MADTNNDQNQIASSSSPNNTTDLEATQPNLQNVERNADVVDYLQRAKWLRAAILGANDGLLTTASLMVGVGAVKKDDTTMVLTGVAGLVAGASSMALGEFVSVYSQCEIEFAHHKREGKVINKSEMSSPFYAALASAVGFAVGATVPLLGAAFIKDYNVRLGVVVAVVSVALVLFGALSGFLGKCYVVKSCLRILVGGWVAMGITFGFTKLVESSGGV